MLRRRLEPKRGHALFFPKTGKVIVGAHEFVWRLGAHDFHHIELGHFPVYVEFGHSKSVEVARSAEGLLFRVKAVFRVETIPTAEALTKATSFSSPGADLSQIITLSEFEKRLQGSLQIVVEQALAKREYLSSNAAQFRQSLLAEIDSAARAILTTKEGFALLACTISELTPEKPSEHTLAQDAELRDKWRAYRGKLDVINDEDKQAEQDRQAREKKRERELQEEEERQNAESEVRRKEIIKKRDEELNTIADDVEQAQEKRAKDRAERQQKNKETEEDIKQKQIIAEKATDLIAAQEAAKLEAAEHKAQLDRITFERKRLQEELDLHQLREQNAKAQAALTEAEAKRLRAIGEAEAAVTREKALAAHAQSSQTHQQLLEALPKILEKVATTGPRAGDVKVMYLGAPPSQSGGDRNDGHFANLISGVSSLSVLRELLQFVGDWNTNPSARGAGTETARPENPPSS